MLFASLAQDDGALFYFAEFFGELALVAVARSATAARQRVFALRRGAECDGYAFSPEERRRGLTARGRAVVARDLRARGAES